MLRRPPDLLITTPESLFLMLTSRARETLTGVRTLILDEVHAVAGTKRGAHLALSVERLERLTGEPFQRIGLSATQRPMEEIGKFVSGGRPIELVDAGRSKELDVEVVVPLEDMREPGVNAEITDLLGTGGESRGQSIWPVDLPAPPRARRGTARPSSSSTTAGWPSGWRCGSTSWPRKRSREPTTAPSPASSGSRSRSC